MKRHNAVVKPSYDFEWESLEQIKKMVKAYFETRHGQAVDYVDLLDYFEYSLSDIVAACAELENEGKIVGIDQVPGRQGFP
jgi:hypothetical protein